MNPQRPPLKLYIKVFSSLFLCSGSISGVAYGGSVIWGAAVSPQVFATGSSIGPVSVADQSRTSAVSLLKDSLQRWQKHGTVRLQWNGHEALVDLSLFTFDVDGSVQRAALSGHSNLTVTLNDEALKDWLQQKFDLKVERLDWLRLKSSLLGKVANLPSKPVALNLESYYGGGASQVVQPAVVEYEVTTPYEILDLKKLANQLEGTEVEPKSSFSLLQTLADKKVELAPGEPLNALASALYGAVLTTNFELVERHIGNSLPIYTPLGYDATVLPGSMDFVFKNPNDSSYILHFQYQPKHFKVIISGKAFSFSYRVSVEEKKEYPPKTILHYNRALSGSQKNVQEEGHFGQSAKIYREEMSGDKVVEKQFIAEDFYFPTYRILETGVEQQDPATLKPPQGPVDPSPAPQTTGPGNTEQKVQESIPNETGSPAQTQTPPEHVIGKKI
jgi:hypothetical protein